VRDLFKQLASADGTAVDYKILQDEAARASLEALAFSRGADPRALLDELDELSTAEPVRKFLTAQELEALLLQETELAAKAAYLRETGLLRGVAKLLPAGRPDNALAGFQALHEADLDALCGQVGKLVSRRLQASHSGMLTGRSADDGDRASADNGGNSKFAMDFSASEGLATAKFGTLDDFENGLDGKIGVPSPDVENAVCAEHCEREDSHHEFEPGNYNIRTTPAKEYKVVTNDTEGQRASCGERRVLPLDELMQHVMARRAEMQRIEVLTLVLYTGPMFRKYNALLRGFPENVVAACKGNTYTTTIHVIMSGLRKLMWATPIQNTLYRGLGDVLLPIQLLEPDENGVRGGVEPGFISTSAKLKTALQYLRGKRQPTVLEIRPGAVDRGASLEWLSQFPGEAEFLLPALSFMETMGITYRSVDGVTIRVVQVRVNANFKSLRLEQLVGRRKALHLATFAHNRLDLEHTMEARGVDVRLRESIRKQLCELEMQHRALDAADAYNKDSSYRVVVSQLLDALTWASSTLDFNDEENRLKRGFTVSDWTLRAAHRQLVANTQQRMVTWPKGSEERRCVALEACRLLGLVGGGAGALEARNEVSETPLMQAAADGQTRHASLLIEAGAMVRGQHLRDSWGDGLVALASIAGEATCVQLLIENEADVNSVNRDNVSALNLAATNGELSCLQALLRAGAHVHLSKDSGSTPLMWAAKSGHASCVRELAGAGHDLLAANNNGHTALMFAAMRGQETCVQAILDLMGRDLDLEVRDKEGKTSLMWAQEKGFTNCADILKSAGGADLPF